MNSHSKSVNQTEIISVRADYLPLRVNRSATYHGYTSYNEKYDETRATVQIRAGSFDSPNGD